MKFLLLLLFFFPLLQAGGLSVQILNDLIYDTDEQRTGGFKVLYQDNENWSFHLGQDVYTPKDTSTITPVSGDRPYNAWLYGGVTYQYDIENIDTLISARFDVGTVGPRALGEWIQNGIHDAVGAIEVQGWNSQTRDRYGNHFVFTAEKSLADILLDSRKELSHLSVYVSADAGTMWRSSTAGISMAFGYNTPYYNTLINFPEDKTFYVFGNIQITNVEKNGLLDENSAYNVLKENFIERYDVGFNWDIDNIRIRFTATTMSKEFTTQVKGHRFAIVELTFGF